MLIYFLFAAAAVFPPRPARPEWSDLECFMPMVGVLEAADLVGVAEAADEAVVVEAVLVALGVVPGVVVVVVAETPTFSFSPFSCFLMVLEEQIC